MGLFDLSAMADVGQLGKGQCHPWVTRACEIEVSSGWGQSGYRATTLACEPEMQQQSKNIVIALGVVLLVLVVAGLIYGGFYVAESSASKSAVKAYWALVLGVPFGLMFVGVKVWEWLESRSRN